MRNLLLNLFIISLLGLWGCNKCFKIAKKEAELAIKPKLDELAESEKAIRILEETCSKKSKPHKKLLAEYYFRLGQLQENDPKKIQKATDTYKKALDYAHEGKAKKDSTLEYHIAYLRCVLRRIQFNDPPIPQLDSLSNLRGLKAEMRLKLTHLSVFQWYVLRGAEPSFCSNQTPLSTPFEKILLGLEAKLKKADKLNLSPRLVETNNFCKGVLYSIFYKKNYKSDKVDYKFLAKEQFDRVNIDNFIYPEMYHITANFYAEIGDYQRSKTIFEQGSTRHARNNRYEFDYANVLKTSLSKRLEYNFFGDNKPYEAMLSEIEERFKFCLENANPTSDTIIIMGSQNALAWIGALRRKPIQMGKLEFMEGQPFYHCLNETRALYWMPRDSNRAIMYWKEIINRNVTGERGAQAHFWIGYYTKDKEKKKYHFGKAIEFSKGAHQDALYFRSQCQLNKQSTEDLEALLNLNPNYHIARERLGYLLLAQAKRKKDEKTRTAALKHFEYLSKHGKDGWIGKGLCDPESVNLSSIVLIKDRYDANTFLACYFALQQKECEESDIYKYFKEYHANFKADATILDIVKNQVQPNLVSPRIDWINYNRVNPVTLLVDSERPIRPIEFRLPNPQLFEKIEVFRDDQLVQEINSPTTTQHKLMDTLLFSDLKLNTPIAFKIVATFKKAKKYGKKAEISEKNFIFQRPNQCDCTKKLAFIFQNTNYEDPNWKLEKTTNFESENLAKLLKKHGFDTIVRKNLSKQAVEDFITGEYKDSLNNYNLILVYYTGHGISQDGKNYLIPTDCAEPNKQSIISTQLFYDQVRKYAKDTFQTNVDNLKNKKFIYIFDMCRSDQIEGKIEDNTKPKSLSHSLIIHTTQEGKSVDQFADKEAKEPVTVYMKYLPNSFSRNLVENDIDQLLNVTRYFPQLTDEQEMEGAQILDLWNNLGCQIFLKKEQVKK
jgi:hypothetical protein